MLFVGYFEGIDSQRGIAWRFSDSLSLRRFLFLSPSEESPDHSSLTRIRERLPQEVYGQGFAFVLKMARMKQLLKDTGRTLTFDCRECLPICRPIQRAGSVWRYSSV